MEATTLDWVRTLGSILVSWPVVALLLVLLFRRPILRLLDRLSSGEGNKAEIGPVKIELGRLARDGQVALSTFNQLSVNMAESRVLELEIFETMAGGMLRPEQRDRMKHQIADLRRTTQTASEALRASQDHRSTP